jgi:predicted secreted Zn-dependent protease
VSGFFSSPRDGKSFGVTPSSSYVVDDRLLQHWPIRRETGKRWNEYAQVPADPKGSYKSNLKINLPKRVARAPS